VGNESRSTEQRENLGTRTGLVGGKVVFQLLEGKARKRKPAPFYDPQKPVLRVVRKGGAGGGWKGGEA